MMDSPSHHYHRCYYDHPYYLYRGGSHHRDYDAGNSGHHRDTSNLLYCHYPGNQYSFDYFHCPWTARHFHNYQFRSRQAHMYPVRAGKHVFSNPEVLSLNDRTFFCNEADASSFHSVLPGSVLSHSIRKNGS